MIQLPGTLPGAHWISLHKSMASVGGRDNSFSGSHFIRTFSASELICRCARKIACTPGRTRPLEPSPAAPCSRSSAATLSTGQSWRFQEPVFVA